MQIFLVIVSLYGGIATVPMDSMKVCYAGAATINGGLTHTAHAYCIRNAASAS